VSLDLGTTPAGQAAHRRAHRKPSPRATIPQLVALVFQYGRYLMISSSRPGGQPANLQGVWNESNNPAWDSKYTDNINTEMNYWPVEETNLGRMPAAAVRRAERSGRNPAPSPPKSNTTRGGWVLHHNFDLWRGTAPINASNHGIWQTGGAWLSTHLWEHYLFTGDRAIPARHRLSADERRGALLRRRAGERSRQTG
jgi:alpha-L-fucosidase 2